MERRLVPGLEYSQHQYEARLLRWIGHRVKWLDVGCGRRLLPTWRSAQELVLIGRASQLTGLDGDLGSLHDNVTVHSRVLGAAEQLPFADAVFDVVTANMVVEHLADPVAAFAGVHRILRPGGLFIFHTPNASAFPTVLSRAVPEIAKPLLSRLLDGRRSADVFPTTYRCNTPSAVRETAERAGFEVAELSLVSTTALFSVVLPLAALELLWLRFISTESREQLRSNIICVLYKR
jgi:ubiquinone/menaquinone biosynthesis C-methylase UbiE